MSSIGIYSLANQNFAQRTSSEQAQRFRARLLEEQKKEKEKAERQMKEGNLLGAIGSGLGAIAGAFIGGPAGASIGSQIGGGVANMFNPTAGESAGAKLVQQGATLGAGFYQQEQANQLKTDTLKAELLTKGYSEVTPDQMQNLTEETKQTLKPLNIGGKKLFFKTVNIDDGELKYGFTPLWDANGKIWTQIVDKQKGSVRYAKGSYDADTDITGKKLFTQNEVPELFKKQPETDSLETALGLISNLRTAHNNLPKNFIDSPIVNAPSNFFREKVLGDTNLAQYEQITSLLAKQIASYYENGKISDKDFVTYKKEILPRHNDTFKQREIKINSLEDLLRKASQVPNGTYKPTIDTNSINYIPLKAGYEMPTAKAVPTADSIMKKAEQFY